MRLAVRNTVIAVGAFMAVVLFCGFLVVGFELLAGGLTLPQELTHTWLVWSWSVRQRDAIASLASSGALGLIAGLGLAGCSLVFRRVSSAEIYFFALFLTSIAFEEVRLLQLYFTGLSVPVFYGALVTRVVIAARIFGISALFVASLYAVGIDYPRIGTVTLVLALLALLFVYFIPVDTVTLSATYLHRTVGQASLELALLITALLTVANYIIAGSRGHRDRGLVLALAVIAIVAGYQVALFVPLTVPLIGALLLLSGGVLTFVLVTRAHVLWY